MYPLKNKLKNRGQTSEYAFSFPKDQRYMSGETLTARRGRVCFAVCSSRHVQSFQRNQGQGPYAAQIVETKGMEKAMVTVDAAAMGGDIEKTGHVAIYGIYFDTDKADIKARFRASSERNGKALESETEIKGLYRRAYR